MANTQQQKIHVVVNNNVILEYDRSKSIPAEQLNYLDNMDQRMNQGITLNGEQHENPDAMLRSQFVANSMVNALFQEKYSLAIAMCTWLGQRIPDLQQVRALGDIASDMKVELVFDRDYSQSQREQPVNFVKQHKPNA